MCLKVLVALLLPLPVPLSTTEFGGVLFPRKQEGKPEDGSKVVEVADDSQLPPLNCQVQPKETRRIRSVWSSDVDNPSWLLGLPYSLSKGEINENYHVVGKYPPIIEK